MSSPPTTPMSQASTKFGFDSSIYLDNSKGVGRRAIERVKEVPVSQDIFLFLLAFRILNALSIKTFFQPDEFFQSLEPAWEIAFGADSGAWITWVSKQQRLKGRLLRASAGVEKPPSFCDTSCNLCRRVYAVVKPLLGPASVSLISRRPSSSGAKNNTGHRRCVGGLLHMEAWGTCLRIRQ